MPIQKKGKPVRSGATPGAAGTMSNPGGVGRQRAPKPIYQGPRSPGAAGTMPNPAGVGRTSLPLGTVATGSGSMSPGTTSSIPRGNSRTRTRGPRTPMANPGGASVSRTATDPVTTMLPNPTLRNRGITTPPPSTTPRPPAGSAPDAVGNAVKKARGDGLRGLMKGRGRGIAIGMGAAVIGGLAYSGRRGEGSSGGRAGMSRY